MTYYNFSFESRENLLPLTQSKNAQTSLPHYKPMIVPTPWNIIIMVSSKIQSQLIIFEYPSTYTSLVLSLLIPTSTPLTSLTNSIPLHYQPPFSKPLIEWFFMRCDKRRNYICLIFLFIEYNMFYFINYLHHPYYYDPMRGPFSPRPMCCQIWGHNYPELRVFLTNTLATPLVW